MTSEPASVAPPSTVEQWDLKTSYLELLKLCLTGLAVPRPGSAIWPHGGEVRATEQPSGLRRGHHPQGCPATSSKQSSLGRRSIVFVADSFEGLPPPGTDAYPADWGASSTRAVIRLDGDLYESTINSLENLYPNRSIGGYATVDDYGVSPHCEKAVDDFRERLGIRDEMRQIDWSGVFWAEDGMSAKGRAAR